MESKAKLFGHAIHPMLIVFPLGLLATAAVFDILYLSQHNGTWAETSFWMITAGLLGGIAAALFGWIDWFAIPNGTRAKAIGLYHGLGNAVVLFLFAVSWYMRRDWPAVMPTPAAVFDFVAVGLTVITGWLGGELVQRMGVSIDRGANLDAPSSLAGGAVIDHPVDEIPFRKAS